MGSILDDRERDAENRLANLRSHLNEATALFKGKACIYVTGSFGRGEASANSDLDVFIVGKEDNDGRLLSRLDEVLAKADLIRACRDLKLPEFSKDGKYLEHYTVHQLCENLGKPEDDAVNTFTSRLLLLLESRPLIGGSVYKDAVKEVVDAYWRDYTDHKDTYHPAFLTNDILRLWRTFCVNYEARTVSEPADEKAKRKLFNYKLKHSRLLTCYSGLLYLAAVYVEKSTVHCEDAILMTEMSPTRRLEWLKKKKPDCTEQISALTDAYEKFLSETARPKGDLIKLFMDAEKARRYMADAKTFSETIYELLHAVAGQSPFFRFLVV
jgi:predicted nucleotidyltransferase